MGKKKKGSKKPGGSHQPIKGFRPGKEPAHLRRQQAKAQLGKDAPWGQKKAVDLVADRSPEEVRAIMNRWLLGFLSLAGLLLIGGVFLYRWTMVAGVAVHVLAVVLLILAYRMYRQRANFIQLAEMVGKGSR